MVAARFPTSDLRRIAARLRRHAPADEVRVRRHREDEHGGMLGIARLRDDGVGIISIRDDLAPEAAIDTLVHEWGHILAWRRWGEDIEEHGPEWGIASAEAYNASRRDV